MQKAKVQQKSHKDKGKYFFLGNSYIEAIAQYQKALDQQVEKSQRAIIIVNIGLCFFRLNLLKSYHQYSKKAIEQNPSYVKAQYHQIKAFIYQKNFQKAEKLLKTNNDIEDNDKKSLLNLINSMKIANQKGYQYSQDWIYALKNKSLQFQYVSKKIEVRKSKFGLGLFAIDNIPQYSIIIVKKPLVYLQQEQRKKYWGKSDKQAMCEKIKKLIKLSKQFEERFKCISTKKVQSLSLQQRQKRNNLTDKQIIEAIQLNWFQAMQFVDQIKGKEQVSPKGSGIYETISLLNHCCQRGCEFFFIGKSMIIRTIYPIQKDQEIFINYYYQPQVLQRQRVLKNIWNIKCDCVFCREQNLMDQGKLQKDPSNFKSKQLRWHVFSSHVFFNGIDPGSKYCMLQNPQMRWKNVLDYHNQNQLKGQIVARMFKNMQNEKKFIELVKTQQDDKSEGLKMFQAFKNMKL